MKENMQYLFFSVCLTLLMIISNPVHFLADDMILFFFMAEWAFNLYLHHICFIRSSIDEHTGWFHILATVNHAMANPDVHPLLLYAVRFLWVDI